MSGLNPYAPRSKRVVEITSDYPGAALPSDLFNNPKSMTLQQKVKGHDVLTLRYEAELKDATRLLRTGSPVTVNWGTTNVGESSTWVGYVHTTRPVRLGNTYGQTEIVCVSPSMIFKQAAQDTWIDRPVVEAAYQIIVKAGLDAMIEWHPLKDNILQQGRTYWQVLRDIASMTGHSLTSDNTTLVMKPHKYFFDTYAPRARVFSPGESLEIAPSNSNRTLYAMTPDWSDLSDDSYGLHAELTTWSIDPRTGTINKASSRTPSSQISSSRANPSLQRFSDMPSYTYTDARRLADDSLADRRWINQATMSGMGSPDIRPYRPVYVDGMSGAVDGWWQVIEVTHEIMNRGEYEVTMRVGRDGERIDYPKPATLPVIPDVEVGRRAVTSLSRKSPAFVTSTPSVTGLAGFGDVGGYWVSQRT